MITREGKLATIMQQQEEGKAQKSTENEQRATTSTPTGKALLIVQRILSLNFFLQYSIPKNLGVASKVTTLAMDSILLFSDFLLHLKAVFRVARKNATVDIGYLWSLECIIYHLLFGSSLCNGDSKQINSLLPVFIYHCFHLFAMFMLLLLSLLALMLLILAFLGIFKNCERTINY